jgi:hypothetical protein
MRSLSDLTWVDFVVWIGSSVIIYFSLCTRIYIEKLRYHGRKAKLARARKRESQNARLEGNQNERRTY